VLSFSGKKEQKYFRWYGSSYEQCRNLTGSKIGAGFRRNSVIQTPKPTSGVYMD
jgi:hypothetical protein